MSQFSVPVVQISKIGKHPNADTLSITQVEGCPVIFQTGPLKEGDLAVYVPVDSVVPVVNTEFSWLKTKEGQTTHRVKAKKLRGIFSMGLLVPVTDLFAYTTLKVGDDVQAQLGITKYEEPEKSNTNGQTEKGPQIAPVYDMESYRKYKDELQLGEQVVVTEKIHGCNGRFVYKDDRIFCGSHRTFKVESEGNVWWKIARRYDLAEKLKAFPGVVLYGEVYGSVQDLKYGLKEGEVQFMAFDAFNTEAGRWMDFSEFQALIQVLGVPTVPVLYHGPYVPSEIEPLADGKTVLEGASNIREGFVIKPVKERWSRACSRVMLKLVSEAYLLRKNGTEHH